MNQNRENGRLELKTTHRKVCGKEERDKRERERKMEERQALWKRIHLNKEK